MPGGPGGIGALAVVPIWGWSPVDFMPRPANFRASENPGRIGGERVPTGADDPEGPHAPLATDVPPDDSRGSRDPGPSVHLGVLAPIPPGLCPCWAPAPKVEFITGEDDPFPGDDGDVVDAPRDAEPPVWTSASAKSTLKSTFWVLRRAAAFSFRGAIPAPGRPSIRRRGNDHRRWRRPAPWASPEPLHPSISLTTRPCTSVRRKSRPL